MRYPFELGPIDRLIIEAAMKGALAGLGQPSPLSSDAVAVRPAEGPEPKKDPLRNIVGRY